MKIPILFLTVFDEASNMTFEDFLRDRGFALERWTTVAYGLTTTLCLH